MIYLEVVNRILGKETFWEKNGGMIIFITIAVLAAVAIVFLGIFKIQKDNREERLVDFAGTQVDYERLVTITLTGHTAVTQLKGELFEAPLLAKDGYEFLGWFYDTAFTKPYYNRPIKSDLILYPKWRKQS